MGLRVCELAKDSDSDLSYSVLFDTNNLNELLRRYSHHKSEGYIKYYQYCIIFGSLLRSFFCCHTANRNRYKLNIKHVQFSIFHSAVLNNEMRLSCLIKNCRKNKTWLTVFLQTSYLEYHVHICHLYHPLQRQMDYASNSPTQNNKSILSTIDEYGNDIMKHTLKKLKSKI